MSFTTDITLTGNDSSSQTYSTISVVNQKTIRRDAARPLGTPRSMTISHTTSGSDLSAIDRHLVRLDLVEEDTELNDLSVISGSVYVVLEVPRRILTSSQIKDMCTQLFGFMTDANITKILNGEG